MFHFSTDTNNSNNYNSLSDNCRLSTKSSSRVPTSPTAESSFTEMEASAVVEVVSSETGGGGKEQLRSTGAIPKKQAKKRTKPTSSSQQQEWVDTIAHIIYYLLKLDSTKFISELWKLD
jgi:hypothetical protein